MNEIFELLKIIIPSAAISAVVSSGLDALKERKREKKKAAHTLLQIAEHLEYFSEKCKDSLNNYSNGLSQVYEYHDSRKLESIEPPTLEFSSSLNWEDLPVKEANSIKSIQKKYEECDKWIHEKWLDGEIGIVEIADLSMQRIAFYGLSADAKAKKIRKQISSPTESISNRNELFNRIVNENLKSKELNNIIPELKSWQSIK